MPHSTVSRRLFLGAELGPFPYSRHGVGEGNHSAQEKLAAVELHFSSPSAFEGSFEAKWVNR